MENELTTILGPKGYSQQGSTIQQLKNDGIEYLEIRSSI